MGKVIKTISFIGTIFIMLPLGTIASFVIPTYHPEHPYIWFWALILGVTLTASATITSHMTEKW